jgi:hypothetical protein
MKKKQKHLIFGLLGLLFFLPGFSAYVLHKYPNLMHLHTVNHGSFVTEQEVVLPELKGKASSWHLILYHIGDCDTLCLKKIDSLARTRLALGRRLYNVDLDLITKKHSLLTGAAKILKNIDVKIIHLCKKNLVIMESITQVPCIFIANAKRQLVLRYPYDAPLEDILADLKHLV